jgi:hypothetical protein
VKIKLNVNAEENVVVNLECRAKKKASYITKLGRANPLHLHANFVVWIMFLLLKLILSKLPRCVPGFDIC